MTGGRCAEQIRRAIGFLHTVEEQISQDAHDESINLVDNGLWT